MRIRPSTIEDLDRIMEIYAGARAFMAANGNPNQWGPTNWPPEQLIRQDIRDGRSYVCVNDEGRVIGTFFFAFGPDIEPTYRRITDGAWLDPSPYGVVHRLAGDGSERGIGAFCLTWALARCGHLRIDTHGDNLIMQNLLRKLGFTHCGTIYVEEDDYPRLAFEKTAAPSAGESENLSAASAVPDNQTAAPAAKRIVVGMSGGVDSSVTAALLQRAGWDVIGVTLDFVSDGSGCCDAADAHAVCEALGIRHLHRDCSPAFEDRVIRPFCDAYAAGLTPSPCPACNATMKIPELLAVADEVGAAFVATGHYVRLEETPAGRVVVKTAADERKDQSYMLSRLSQEQLRRLVLPLGGMTKAEVRALAAELNLPVAQRPDSEDLCFAPEGYRALLAERGVEGTPGPILNAAGKQLGIHTGLVDYTIGQRSGLGIGGAPEPYYVMAKDAAANALVVGFAGEAKMRAALVTDPVWQAIPAAPGVPLRCTVKLRYRSRAVPCTLEVAVAGEATGEGAGQATFAAKPPATQSPTAQSPASDMLRITLADPQPLTAPGQFAVFYSGDTVLGSGIIAEVIREQ